jgi:ribosomal protein S18 acetylase RimI-like enzyme
MSSEAKKTNDDSKFSVHVTRAEKCASIVIQVKRDNSVIGSLCGAPYVGIVSIEVNENERRKGIGTLLLNRYESELAEHTNLVNIVFECHEDNAPALAMYKKLGYKQTKNDDCTEYCVCLTKTLQR